MTTNAKVGIAVGMLIPVVFVVTLISQLPKQPDQDTPLGGEDGVPAGGLRAAIGHMKYDPNGQRAALRGYQQYYERGDHLVTFWVSNPNPVPLTVTFADTSCGQCAFADVAVVPAPVIDGTADPNPWGAVAGGVLGRTAVGPNDPAPFGLDELEYRERQLMMDRVPAGGWTRVKAIKVNDYPLNPPEEAGAVVIPAAENGKPTWAVMKLNIKVTEIKTLQAVFASRRPDEAVPSTLKLYAMVAPAEPCEIFPTAIDFQTVAEDVGVLERTVYFYSTIRPVGPAGAEGVLPPPDVTQFAGHITFTPPVPATADETAALAQVVTATTSAEVQVPKRVAGAYKTTLRFARTVRDGEKLLEADLGPFERTLSVVPATGKDEHGNVLRTPMNLNKTPTVTVKARLLGAVELERGEKIDLGSFRTRDGLDREVVVVSDRPGLELEAVPEQCTPKYLKVERELKGEKKGDRTRWTLRLKIDEGAGGGEIEAGSVVVLRIKGTGQLVRIPVTGRGGG